MSQFLCSCGREFAFEGTLQRHCSATGHHPLEVKVEAPSEPLPVLEDPRELALRVLILKRAEQAAYESQLQHPVPELVSRGLFGQLLNCLGRFVDALPDLDCFRLR